LCAIRWMKRAKKAACQICFDPVGAANPLHSNCLLHRADTNRREKTVETADRLENKRLTEWKKKRNVQIAVFGDTRPCSLLTVQRNLREICWLAGELSASEGLCSVELVLLFVIFAIYPGVQTANTLVPVCAATYLSRYLAVVCRDLHVALCRHFLELPVTSVQAFASAGFVLSCCVQRNHDGKTVPVLFGITFHFRNQAADIR